MITIKRSFRPGRGLIRPEELSGYVFSPEAGAHTFIITKIETIDGQETAVPFAAGTDISCRFVKADGVTELVDGSLTDDGEASVTLSAECYQVPGRFILFVFAENGDENVCIYSATSTALAGDTAEINPSSGARRTVDETIAALNAAVENADEIVAQVQEDVAEAASTVQDLVDSVDVATMPEFLSYLDTDGTAQPADEVAVSGANPVITAQKNTMYVCGEVQTLSFTPNPNGISAVQFGSGTTAAILTVPNTVRWPAWFDPSALEANTVYEISVRNGVFGAVMTWQ